MPVTNGYLSVDDLREQLRDTGLKLDQELLERAVNATCRAVDDYCGSDELPGGGRRFWQDPSATARVYRPDEPHRLWVDDISTQTGLVVATDEDLDGTYETTWAASDYRLEPLNADGDGGAYAWWRLCAQSTQRLFPSDRFGRPTVQVTARFGWSAVPDPVAAAAVLKAAKLFKRKDSPTGWQTGQFGAVRISRFEDPDVAALLDPYVKATHRTLDYDPQAGSLFHAGRR